MSEKSSRRVLLKDIAAETGVSLMTASLALNGRRGVSAKRREEIRQVAERMGYRLNDAARLLKSKKILDIGLVLSETPAVIRQNAGFCDLLASFMIECGRRRVDYRLEWIDQTHTDTEIPKIFNNGLAGSLLIAGWVHDSLREYIETRLKLPYVRIGEPGVYSVENDYANGLQLAVCHLFSRGHRRIALLNDSAFAVFDESRRGYLAGLAECGLEPNPAYYREMDHTQPYDREVPRWAEWVEKMSPAERPTALICSNGLFAKALLYDLTRRGIHTPEDLSLVAFMTLDWEVAQFSPGISAVEYGMMDLVVPALDMLWDLAEHREVRIKNIKVPPKLTERSSVARVPGS